MAQACRIMSRRNLRKCSITLNLHFRQPRLSRCNQSSQTLHTTFPYDIHRLHITRFFCLKKFIFFVQRMQPPPPRSPFHTLLHEAVMALPSTRVSACVLYECLATAHLPRDAPTVCPSFCVNHSSDTGIVARAELRNEEPYVPPWTGPRSAHCTTIGGPE